MEWCSLTSSFSRAFPVDKHKSLVHLGIVCKPGYRHCIWFFLFGMIRMPAGHVCCASVGHLNVVGESQSSHEEEVVV